jgi:hypothetical protein
MVLALLSDQTQSHPHGGSDRHYPPKQQISCYHLGLDLLTPRVSTHSFDDCELHPTHVKAQEHRAHSHRQE